MAPGPFKVTWRGFINLRIRGEYHFSAEGNGAVRVLVNDTLALESTGNPGPAVKLVKGPNKLEVQYISPPQGDAQFKLFWSSRDFPAEPLSPLVLTFDSSDAEYQKHSQLRQGRQLFATLRCTKCHPAGADLKMPELSMDAPTLVDIGARLNQSWMASWISNPRAIRPDSSMPRLFQGTSEASDIAAYLATLGTSTQSPPADAATGAHLFTALGCIACHIAPDVKDPADAPQRISLRLVRAKWKPAALVDFLKKPDAHYAWIRMPTFHLSDPEAAALAAYLMDKAAAGALPQSPTGDPAKGKSLVSSSGCLKCHTLTSDNSYNAPAVSDWKHGCLATDQPSRGHAPDFNLTADERNALAAFGTTGLSSLSNESTIETAQRQIAILNCNACHTRDKQSDTWSSLAKEIEAIKASLPPPASVNDQNEPKFSPDQSRPLLTWTGEKLKPEWMEKFIAGQISDKPRPWLEARMPSFPARAKLLAQGIAAEHGNPAISPPDPAPDVAQAAIGQKLASRNGGFSCSNCHAIGPAKAYSPFEAPAPNFAMVKDRLRKEYYHWWVRSPIRIDPGTRMPQFGTADGTTPLKTILDGDAHKQFEAIWQYILEGNAIQPAE